MTRASIVQFLTGTAIALGGCGMLYADDVTIGCRSQIDQSGGAAVRRLDTVIGN